MRVYSVFILITICFVQTRGDYKLKLVDPDVVEPRSTANRIVGGQATTIEEWPFIVQVLMNLGPRCAGSILTSRHVLSAAHCFFDNQNALLPVSLFSIRAGSTTLWQGGTLIYVEALINHPDYNTRIARDNDIAVLLLQYDLTFSSGVQVAGIPEMGYTVPDDSSVAYVGWGATATEQVSRILQEVWVYKVNNEVCEQRYKMLEAETGLPWPVTSSMICAGLLDIGGKDACSGDSGGPMVYNGAVVGIVSWGWNCAESLYPGVNSRVSNFTDWIADSVNQLSQESTTVLLEAMTTPRDEINVVDPEIDDDESIEEDDQTNSAILYKASIFVLIVCCALVFSDLLDK